MWNYDLVLPNCVIICTFLAFYFMQPRLPIKINKAFVIILLLDIITIISDVTSSHCLEYFSHLPPFFLRVQNVIYFILFVQRIICFFMFTIAIVGKSSRKSIGSIVLDLFPFIVLNIIIFLNLFTNTIFCISNSGEYSQGPLHFMIYVCAFYYVSLSIIYTFVYRRKISKNYFIGCLIFNSILFIGYIIRILFPKYLIMNFFTLITIIIIYLVFQNPTLFIEEKSGLFNIKAFETLFKEMRFHKSPLILGFTIHNYNDLREIYSNTQTDKGLSLIGDYLKQTFPYLKSFYLHDGRFVLVGRNSTVIDFVRGKIALRFEASWNTDEDLDMYLDINFTQIDPQVFSYEKEIIFTTFVSALNDEVGKNKSSLIDIACIQNMVINKKVKRAVETAVELNTVELFLQPLIDSKTKRLIAAESLARLHDSHGSLISPTLFIPIAEKNGRINALGEQMFIKTCQFIAEHDIKAMGLEWINVNLSPLQFLRPDLAKRFADILNEYKVSADKIHLEITEESMIDFNLLQKQMKLMNAYGFQFVLDDYGRGYSNVARMKKCPFVNIKLDMEFVWDYIKEKDTILPMVIKTIKQMGFTVTAEGIENQEIARAMKEIGCDYLQGFYYSRPLPAEEFATKYNPK